MAMFLFIDDMLINVLLNKERPSGGAAVQSYAWIRGLLSEGHNVKAMTNIKYQHDAIKEECRDLDLVPLYDSNKGIRWLRVIYYRIPFLFKSIKKIKPDYFIVGIPHWTTFILGLICVILKVKMVVRISCDHLIDHRIYQFHSRAHKLLLNWGLSLSYALICQNDYQYKILKKKYPKKKIGKFPNPYYCREIHNSKLPSNLPNDRSFIAWVGLFQYQKNLKLLYEIALKLKNHNFKIAGEENFTGIDLNTRNYIEKLHSLKNVEFVGYLGKPALIEFLKHAKFLLNTSHYEGFSNTYIESMFCGTPVLTTKNANPDFIISDKNLGFVYEDPVDLKTKLEALSGLSYHEMSMNSIKYVFQYHDYKNLSKKLVEFLSV